jgi:hypothetical protein
MGTGSVVGGSAVNRSCGKSTHGFKPCAPVLLLPEAIIKLLIHNILSTYRRADGNVNASGVTVRPTVRHVTSKEESPGLSHEEGQGHKYLDARQEEVLECRYGWVV